MANLIGICSEPGSGKSTLMKGLPPEETFYFDADGKGMNWKGWRNQYSQDKKNYIRNSFPQTAIQYLKLINEKCPKVHYFVVDTVNNLMTSDEMRRCREKGYDKWMDMAQCIWDLVDLPGTMRDDLTVILLFHTQTDMTEDGYKFTKIKTNGRKTEKNNIDSKFNWLFRLFKQDGKYFLETTANDSTSRTPIDAFEEQYVDITNKVGYISEILKVVNEY